MLRKIYKELVAIRKELQSIRRAMEFGEKGCAMTGIDWWGECKSDFSPIAGCEKIKYHVSSKEFQDSIKKYRQCRFGQH